MKMDFRQLVEHLSDSLEVTAFPPFIKLKLNLKYTNEMRADVSLVLGTLKSKGVLFARIDNEIWSYVFKSLKEIRDILSTLSGKLLTKAPDGVKSAVDFMLNLVTLYLAEHEADYIRFMESPDIHNLGSFHRERNWPNLGKAAEDLLVLRKLLYAAIQNLNQYASTGDVLDWEPPPEYCSAKHWAKFAEERKLCPQCNWNMYYAYDDDCPVCPTDKTVFKYVCPDLRYEPKSVEVAGSFNNWNSQPMADAWHTMHGAWIYRVKLPPGEYTYKFIIDGEWVLDPENHKTSTDESGRINSVILVES